MDFGISEMRRGRSSSKESKAAASLSSTSSENFPTTGSVPSAEARWSEVRMPGAKAEP